jgi:hypothetical protein
MSDYKSDAKVSRQEKLKAMGFAGGGNVSPIWKSVPPTLPSGASRQAVSPPISKASAPFVGVSSMALGGNVIRGPAAEREMARMEKEAKTAGNRRQPEKPMQQF